MLGPTANPFYLQMIPLIAARLAERQRPLMLLRVKAGAGIEETLGLLARHQVSGAIIGAASMTPEAAALCRRFSIPTVTINRLEQTDGAFVNCDNVEAGRQVGRLLAAEGRERLAYVGGAPGTATVQDREREQGFREATAAAGLAAAARVPVDYGYDGGVAAAAALLAQRPWVDAVFAANDLLALGLLDGLRRAGVRVPQEVSVVGFDDLPEASWLAYDLTTVRQPMELIAERALEALDLQAIDAAAPSGVFVPAQIIERGTTLGARRKNSPR